MINVYCISGLGADERVYQNLNIKNAKLIHIDWPDRSKEETMSSYALKIFSRIPEKNPVVMGVSFGGMLAVEIAKSQSIRKAFLISSAKTNREKPKIPNFFKHIVAIIPAVIFTRPNRLLYWLFGVESKKERLLLRDIMRDSDAQLVKWSIQCILDWENYETPGSIFHIHGEKDRLIKPKNIAADSWIADGGHFMIYNRTAVISTIIQKQIDTI